MAEIPSKYSNYVKLLYMGQSIQEWTKYNLWKEAFNKIEGIWSA